MTTATIEVSEVLLAGPGAKVTVPGWAQRYKPTTVGGRRILQRRKLPAVTVIHANKPGFVFEYRTFVSSVASLHERTPGPSKVVVVFGATGQGKTENLKTWLKLFSRAGDVEFARGPEEASFALEEALAKVETARERAAIAVVDPDPLGKIKALLGATAGLRGRSGRLSASRVAEAYGLSLSELSKLLGRSKQTVSKTPDAASLQEPLRPFERAARLRALLDSNEFRHWLNASNDELEGNTPIEIIRSGRPEVVATLAEDMLTGRPA